MRWTGLEGRDPPAGEVEKARQKTGRGNRKSKTGEGGRGQERGGKANGGGWEDGAVDEDRPRHRIGGHQRNRPGCCR